MLIHQFSAVSLTRNLKFQVWHFFMLSESKSWNFRHIVNFQKIPRYNAVNTLNGYKEIAIYSPLEVIEYED